jgi:mono/diheme cytochrome c family protein
MQRPRIRSIVPAALLLILATTALAGGWAVITVQNLPEYLVAGKPTTVTFLIRQHGRTLADMNASLSATGSNGLSAKAVVTRTGKPGEYQAILSVPQPGDWTIQIDADLGKSVWRPIKAIRPEDPTPAAISDVVRGEHLFVAKGCITCHVNKEVEGKNLLAAGPELTGKKYPADFLKKFLADPAATMGKPSESFDMPNLNLSKNEIDAIAAFINRERLVKSTGVK